MPAPSSTAIRRSRAIIAIVGISAAFAAGFFTGSFFPLGDDGTVTADPDTTVAEPPPTPDSAVDTGAADDIGEPVPTTPNTTGPAVASDATSPAFYPYTLGDYGAGPCAPAGGVTEAVLDFVDAPALCIDVSASYTAVFDTSRGTVRVALNAANTPGTVNNFVNLARFGYYDGTLLHRSDPSIGILQGGSPHTDDAGDVGPGYLIWDEGAGFSYVPGQLVMARTAGPNSADAQFFFTVTDAAALLDGQGTYVVFGEVVEGLDVLGDILNSHLDEPGNDFGGAPDPPVVINSVTIETQGDTNPPIISTEGGGLFYYPFALGDYGAGPCAPADGVDELVLDFADAPVLCIDVTATHTAVFDTSRGTVRVVLDAVNTPGTVNNFVNLARFGYYDRTLIHRSDPSIGILQGGSPHTDDANDPGPGYQVRDEGAGFSYVPGQLAMARTTGAQQRRRAVLLHRHRRRRPARRPGHLRGLRRGHRRPRRARRHPRQPPRRTRQRLRRRPRPARDHQHRHHRNPGRHQPAHHPGRLRGPVLRPVRARRLRDRAVRARRRRRRSRCWTSRTRPCCAST